MVSGVFAGISFFCCWAGQRESEIGANRGTITIRVASFARWRSLSLENRQIGLFSGVDFSIDVDSGLNGVCDFLLTRSTDELVIEAPAIVLIEARKGELNAGWGQCAAEMIAAQMFNLANGQEVPTIYGSVTTGTQWQFLKLSGKDLTIDTTEYSLNPIDRILGILKWMVDIDDAESSEG